MVMLYEGGLKKLATTDIPAYLIMSYSVSRMGYIVGYVVLPVKSCVWPGSISKSGHNPASQPFAAHCIHTKSPTGKP
jgi:hypothetical protein